MMHAMPPAYGQDGPLIGPNSPESEITDWQRFLVRQGLNIGGFCDDGDFGDATQAATRAFQVRVSLSPVGVVGPQTIEAAIDLGFGETNQPDDTSLGWEAPLTVGERTGRCSGEGLAPASRVIVATAKTDPPVNGLLAKNGPIGKLADDLFTPRGIGLTVGILAVGAGLMLALRR